MNCSRPLQLDGLSEQPKGLSNALAVSCLAETAVLSSQNPQPRFEVAFHSQNTFTQPRETSLGTCAAEDGMSTTPCKLTVKPSPSSKSLNLSSRLQPPSSRQRTTTHPQPSPKYETHTSTSILHHHSHLRCLLQRCLW